MNMHALIRTTLFCATFAVGLSFAQENYGTNWHSYRTITVNTMATGGGANVAGTVTNFPVLVRLTATQTDVFNQANGNDIRFVADNGTTRLQHQRERWDEANKLAEFWVLVPSVAGNASTTFRMYWGNNAAPDSSNGPRVFDTANGFRSVWHMGNATGMNPRPNATYFSGLTATPRGDFDTIRVRQGAIAMADSFPGGAGGLGGFGDGVYMMIDSGTGIHPTAFRFPNDQFTVTMWTKNAALNANSRHFHMLSGNNNTNAPENAIQSIPSSTGPGSLYFRFRTNANYSGNNAGGDGPNGAAVAAQVVLMLDTWQHIAGVVSRGDVRDTLIKYVDGVEYGRALSNATSPRMNDTARSYVFFGRAFENDNDVAYNGSLDEIAFANATRSAAWIKLAFETQKPAATAVTIGARVTGILPGGSLLQGGLDARKAGSSMVFTIPQGAEGMRVSVTDFRGRTVWSRVVAAGVSEISWDGKAQGRQASAGVYFVRLISSGSSATEMAAKKFTLTP